MLDACLVYKKAWEVIISNRELLPGIYSNTDKKHVFFFYVQCVEIPVVNSQDQVNILMLHPKMPSLRNAAGNTYVGTNKCMNFTPQ